MTSQKPAFCLAFRFIRIISCGKVIYFFQCYICPCHSRKKCVPLKIRLVHICGDKVILFILIVLSLVCDGTSAFKCLVRTNTSPHPHAAYRVSPAAISKGCISSYNQLIRCGWRRQVSCCNCSLWSLIQEFFT